MSLINDALKRAKEAQATVATSSEPEQPMKPVEAQPDAATSKGLPPYFLPAVLVVLSGACWFLIKGWEARRHEAMSATSVSVQARENVPAPANVATAGTEKSGPVSLPVAAVATLVPVSPASGAATAATVPTLVPALASVPATDPAPVRPAGAFRLQGIFYRPSSPSAVINAKTVFIGDTVDDAKVKSIDTRSVTLVYEGQTKVLTLH